MAHMTDQERTQLESCETVQDMLNVLDNNFDLTIMPAPLMKKFIIIGLCQAIEALKPVRREKRRTRKVAGTL